MKVFYDRGELEGLAKEAFGMIVADRNPAYRCFVSSESKGWEDCVPLQAADFMAYEGFKRIDGALKGKDVVKKSLQALVKSTTLLVAHFQEENFADIMRMIENQRAGRALDEGIDSGLMGLHGRAPFLPGAL